jgi:hypothetical protein
VRLLHLALTLTSLAGCAAAARAGDHPDGGLADDGALPGDGAVGDGASPDAAVVDTCPTPTTAWTTVALPRVGVDVTRRHAVLQLTTGQPARVLSADAYGNGSFYNVLLVGLTPGNRATLYDNEYATSVRELAATSGDDPCAAYSDDYNGQLHVACAHLGERIAAPAISSSLAIARAGATLHLVYSPHGDALVYMPYADGPAAPETIATTWSMGPARVVVDAAGVVHVAFLSEKDNGSYTKPTHSLTYAVRRGGAWTTTVVDAEPWSGSDGDALALALDGGRPVIAYHHRGTRSLKVARGQADGSFALATLRAPIAGFDNDAAGEGVALATDCVGRVHLAYQRHFTTDPVPSQLLVGRLTAAGLVDEVALPDSTNLYVGQPHGLTFAIAPDGHAWVAAEYGSGTATYLATR